MKPLRRQPFAVGSVDNVLQFPRLVEYTAQPRADLSIRIDRITGKYTRYKEFTPGSLLVAPCDLLEHPFTEVVPGDIADKIDRAAWYAAKHERVEHFSYTLKNRTRRAYVSVHEQQIRMDINEVNA